MSYRNIQRRGKKIIKIIKRHQRSGSYPANQEIKRMFYVDLLCSNNCQYLLLLYQKVVLDESDVWQVLMFINPKDGRYKVLSNP